MVLFLGNGVRYAALVFTFVAVLTTFGIATTSFVAVLGALGIAIGLALQGTLSNLAAGIMLVLFRPFHIGDRIETGGVAGRTCMINLFYTEIDGDDNARIIIPNGKLWGEIVRVPSHNDTARIDLAYPRPANDDIGAAIGRLKDLIERDKRVLRVDDIGVESIGDGNYTLAAHVWVKRPDERAVKYRSQPHGEGRVRAAGPQSRSRRGGAPRRIGLASRPWIRPSASPPNFPWRFPTGKPAPFDLSGARRCSPSATSTAAPTSCARCWAPSANWQGKAAAGGAWSISAT